MRNFEMTKKIWAGGGLEMGLHVVNLIWNKKRISLHHYDSTYVYRFQIYMYDSHDFFVKIIQ